jgi:hypothetical protein
MENVHVWIGGQNPTQNATLMYATIIVAALGLNE